MGGQLAADGEGVAAGVFPRHPHVFEVFRIEGGIAQVYFMRFRYAPGIKRDRGVIQRSVVVSADRCQEIRDIGPEGLVEKPHHGIVLPVPALKNQVHGKERQDAVFRLPRLGPGQKQGIGEWPDGKCLQSLVDSFSIGLQDGMFGVGEPSDDSPRLLAKTMRSVFSVPLQYKGPQQSGQFARREPAASIHGKKAFLSVDESRRPSEIRSGLGLNRGMAYGIAGDGNGRM